MKSILVHLDASPRAAERLAMAQRLARQHGAELTACHAVLPALLASPWMAGEGMATAAALLAEVDRTQLERARATYDAAARQGPVLWAEAEGPAVLQSFKQRALLADLLVLGQHDPDDLRTGGLPADLVPDVLADTGRPALVVPRVGTYEVLARQVLVAWKPTREAARAVTAALPWLQQATQVHVATPTPEDNGIGDTVNALEHWLRLHGVGAPLHRHHAADRDVGESLLSLAADTGADLLVMGCYGHSRTREWVLGGATRTMLESMTLPVLMVH